MLPPALHATGTPWINLERWFAEVTVRNLRHDTHRSVAGLNADTFRRSA